MSRERKLEDGKILRKIFCLNEKDLPAKEIFPDGMFYENFSDYIRGNNKLLKESIICQGLENSWNTYNIEPTGDTITLLGSESLKPAVSVFNRGEFIPKSFGIEMKIPYRADEPDEKTEREIIENFIYKPMSKAIEKQCISGNYFHKSLFNTITTISGTSFNGLLELARTIKNKTDNSSIVIHPVIMESILDSTMPTEYKQEFLFNQTIESVPVIQTIEAPANMAVAYDRTKIVLSLTDELIVKKLSNLGDTNYYYQIVCLCNFADLFNTSIVLQVN
jgi:hypothetical protein